eukprot:NODE_6950_length_520_cov_16.127389_g6519_i0.p1 GENE.NODE_6950_length_520_cov_16.127389_g6519_i0~~NODE_6950_length_520_cov_16.127389_g6519_i0.p1  ORF type:complete len:137 (-),score=1.43 NODE_6950_length_520_cov_16.127389_g6519_i0:17-427(-)
MIPAYFLYQHQPPTTNHQLPTTNHQPPTTNHFFQTYLPTYSALILFSYPLLSSLTPPPPLPLPLRSSSYSFWGLSLSLYHFPSLSPLSPSNSHTHTIQLFILWLSCVEFFLHDLLRARAHVCAGLLCARPFCFLCL